MAIPYTELMINFSAITVEVISPSDPPATGERYSLMCTVTRADSLNPTINYQWFKTTPSRTQVGTNSSILTFDLLVLSDAGQYSCEVTISSFLLSRNIVIVSKHSRLKFISKFTDHAPLKLFPVCEFQTAK